MTPTKEHLQSALDDFGYMSDNDYADFGLPVPDGEDYMPDRQIKRSTQNIIFTLLDQAISKMETVEPDQFDWERDIEILKSYVLTNEVETKRLDRLAQLIKSLKGK